ncbi:MAG TPA: hypothetical protein VMT89_02965 [Candidatus Acidoferrales bacterium]|nr:hypothetical protein [Candidatus Acidoferrales bacterium]
MTTKIDEIADSIFRFSTFVPEVPPDGITFNQFLIQCEQPLLFHALMDGSSFQR